MIFTFPLTVQTYDSSTEMWGQRTFQTKQEFNVYVRDQFKLPGKYNLHHTKSWQQEYNKLQAKGYYTPYIKGTPHNKNYWKNEKDKVLHGIIVDEFYIPPFYYFYLNFLTIYNKVAAAFKAPDIYDGDYHFMLYITLCILEGKHAAVVKTRQRGYSYKIMAILYWSYIWFAGAVNTIGASDEDFVKKTWKYVNEYRKAIHKNTVWKRGPSIPKSMDWIENILSSDGDYVGLGSTLSGTTFKQSPSKGVGGPQKFFFYEEAGIAPTLLSTIEFIRPTIEEGDLTTGLIIVSGSVGELEDCEDLKKIAFNPKAYNFMGVPPVAKEDEIFKETCFFVPDSWNRYGYMDSDGNSDIAAAENSIRNLRIVAKDGKSMADFQLQVSQKPLSLKEAFAYRKESFFPQAIVNNQLLRLEIEKPKLVTVELFETKEGKISFKTETDARPINSFPLQNALQEGAVQIKEFPEANTHGQIPFLTYFAGVDPISTDKTTTSESLFSVYIFKNLTETKTEDEDGNVKIKVSGFEPVAWYTGRMDDLKKTNTIAEYLIRYYNAFTIVESNVQNFINHMQQRGLQRYLATKQDIKFIDDLGTNREVYKQYGVHMNQTIKNYVLSNIKEYLQEEMDIVYAIDGEKVRTIYGAERIPDIPLLQEFQQYHDKLNTDRVIAFGLALSFAKGFVVNGIVNRKSEIRKQEETLMATPRSFFKSVDGYLNPIKQQSKSFFRRHG
jgi:hypothetical protein